MEISGIAAKIDSLVQRVRVSLTNVLYLLIYLSVRTSKCRRDATIRQSDEWAEAKKSDIGIHFLRPV